MSTDITETTSNLPASIADLFSVEAVSDDLSAGVGGGFAIVSIRGSKWRIKYGGNETPVVDENDEPKPSLEVIMVDASPNLSKIFYSDNYSEGDAEAPDCSSMNGISPDAGVPNKQSDSCAMCTNNQWGSRMTESGKKAKLCHDARRVAVVPAGDIQNETNGGVMLLRIPAASLADLKTFNGQLTAKGISYRTIAMRLGFDMDASYPKLTFKATRRLTEDEMVQVAEHITSGATKDILESTDVVPVAAAVEPEPAPVVEEVIDDGIGDLGEPEKPVAVKKAATKKAAPKKKKAEVTELKPSTVDDEMDDILGDLDNLS